MSPPGIPRTQPDPRARNAHRWKNEHHSVLNLLRAPARHATSVTAPRFVAVRPLPFDPTQQFRRPSGSIWIHCPANTLESASSSASFAICTQNARLRSLRIGAPATGSPHDHVRAAAYAGSLHIASLHRRGVGQPTELDQRMALRSRKPFHCQDLGRRSSRWPRVSTTLSCRDGDRAYKFDRVADDSPFHQGAAPHGQRRRGATLSAGTLIGWLVHRLGRIPPAE